MSEEQINDNGSGSGQPDGADQTTDQAGDQSQQPEGNAQNGDQAGTQSEPESEPETQPQAETQATESPAEPVAQPVLFRIEQARNLPELDKDVKAEPAGLDKITFQAFKATDGRTMRVVELDGTLYAQEA